MGGLQTQINNLVTNANSNTAAYLQTNSLTIGSVSNPTAIGGNLTVSGNLLVTGNITTVNYETVLYTETANVLNVTTLNVGATSNLNNISNITITGGASGYAVVTNGAGALNFSAANAVVLGTNSVGQLSNPSVSYLNFTSTTNVTDSIANMNYILAKLVPASPPTFPGNVATSFIASSTPALTSGTVFATTYIMTGDAARGTGWWQPNYIAGNTFQVSGGASIGGNPGTGTQTVMRANTYTTTTLAAVGPGNSGNIVAWLNGNIITGFQQLTGSLGTVSNGNLTITNNTDFHNIVSSVAAGFWYSANISATGTAGVYPGWNTVIFQDVGAGNGNSNPILWYNDISSANAGTPTFANTSATLTTNVVTYSSTIPHFASGTVFRLKGNVTNLSGDLYYGNTALSSTTTASGAFQAPTAVPYASSYASANYWNGTVPLPRYLANPTYGQGTSVYYETNVSTLATGFGSSNAGASITMHNSYNQATQLHVPSGAPIILYKNGTGTAIDETTIATTTPIGAVSGGSYRIVYSQSTDTPVAVTGSETVWNSTTTALGLMDATVVGSGTGGRIQYDVTNYSAGYLPVGPNLSGQNTTQYFTMRFAQAGVTTFYLNYSGICSAIYCAMPTSGGVGGTNATNVSNGTWNGWLTAGVLNPGGVPGPGSAGNGSTGCVTGTVPTFGSLVTSGTGSGKMQIYFGTTNSTAAVGNYIYIRFKLTAGQYISALSITAA